MLRFEGDGFSEDQREALEAFCAKLEEHPHGGRVEGRIVVAENRPEGMLQALKMYMDAEEYAGWLSRQQGRTGVTGGKAFVADDGIRTAVLAPLSSQDLLDLAAHEAIELAFSAQQDEDAVVRPSDPDEADGLTLYDEYRVERARREVSDALNWLEGSMDTFQSLHRAVAELAARMPSQRFDPPPSEFLRAWLEMARGWVMACGRAAGGSRSAYDDLGQWSEHPLIADDNWEPVQRSLGELFAQPGLGFEELGPFAASLIRRPILEYGHDAWRRGP